MWSDAVWCHVLSSGVTRCHGMCSRVMWCDVMWCDVLWCDVIFLKCATQAARDRMLRGCDAMLLVVRSCHLMRGGWVRRWIGRCCCKLWEPLPQHSKSKYYSGLQKTTHTKYCSILQRTTKYYSVLIRLIIAEPRGAYGMLNAKELRHSCSMSQHMKHPVP